VRVLLTGAAGRIGRVVGEGLAHHHELRGLDLRPAPPGWAGEYVVGDCADPDVALGAVAGMDAVVHLAGSPGEATLPAVLRGHVESTAALLDAMDAHGVGRMVYASSNHAVGMAPRSALLRTDIAPAPDTFYGVGKVAAEALLRLYADRHGITGVALRIGSFRERPTDRRALSTWLSHDDACSLVHAALTAEVSGFTVAHGISANRDAWWDLGPGRALGYHPRDDAADHESAIPAGADDDAAAARVGGSLAAGPHRQRPFDRPGA
jgi:uronate dehydrogenase